MNWYKHHLGDYIKKTRHLSLLEHGAYRQLLDMQYLTEKPLPSDVNLIFKSTGAETALEQTVICRVIKEFFRKTRWGYINDRAMEEITAFQSVSKERAAAANKRWSKTKPEDASAYANASSLHMQNACIPRSQNQSQNQEQESRNLGSSQAHREVALDRGGVQRGSHSHKRRARSRATAFPADFKLDEELVVFAQKHGIDWVCEFPAFRDHHQARGSTFKDWRAAWRTWVRRVPQFRMKGDSNSERQRKTQEAARQVLQEASDRVLQQARRPLPH